MDREEIREAIREAYGKNKPLGCDKDYVGLQMDIMDETGGDKLDVNTLKRFFDHWEKEKRGEIVYKFNRSTENSIARYLGYNDWEDMEDNFGMKNSYIQPQSIYQRGDKVTVTYLPNRTLLAECLAPSRFRIMEVRGGGKLRPGDEFTILSFVKGALLVITDLKRDGVILGSYTSSGVIVEVKKERKKGLWD